MKLGIVQLATLATLFVLGQSRLCPSQHSTDTVSTVEVGELLEFPNTGYFFVVDNRQQDWLLLMVEQSLWVSRDGKYCPDLQLTLIRMVDPIRSYAFLRGYLYTPEPNRLIYYFYAEGPISDFSIRGSPDFKWATLKNIQINGTSTTYSPPLVFTVTIPYADFWSDEPADDISTSRWINEDPDSGCVTEALDSGGRNRLISKSFPIYFDFSDGLRLEFIIPQGEPNAFYVASISERLYKNLTNKSEVQ